MMVYNLEKDLIELPSVQAGKNVWQNRFHEFDVYDHTLECVKHLKGMTSEKDMIAAAYLHDIGKPVVKKPRIRNGLVEKTESGESYHIFTDHERVGEEMINGMDAELFLKYGLNQAKISKLVGGHGIPVQGIFKMRDAEDFSAFKEEYLELERAINELGVPKKDVMNLFMADTYGHSRATHPDLNELTGLKNALLDGGLGLSEIFEIQQRMDYSSRKIN